MSRWRVEKMCNNCPFQKKGPGRRLALSLRRFGDIKAGLLRGDYFMCHKTTTSDDDLDETEEGGPGAGGLYCAGALDFQGRHGVSSQYARVCERLEVLK